MDRLRCKVALTVLGFTVLTACGGGGGSSGGASVTPPPVIANADPGGIWYGYASNTTRGETYEVVGVSISSGELRFIDSQGVQYHGSMQVSGTSFNASFRAIAPLGEYFVNGGTVLAGTMTGSISQRRSLDGSYQMSSGERGTVSLLFDDLYQRPSGQSLMTGTWIDVDNDTYSIDSTGRIFGQDSFGCVYSGDAGVIDARYNAYRFNLTVSNCGVVNGTYAGLGVLQDWQSVGDNRLLTLQLSNDAWSLTVSLGKL